MESDAHLDMAAAIAIAIARTVGWLDLGSF